MLSHSLSLSLSLSSPLLSRYSNLKNTQTKRERTEVMRKKALKASMTSESEREKEKTSGSCAES
jgi:hypothetical protein